MNNNMPSKTGWFIIICSFIMLLWELYVILVNPSIPTLSEELWQMNDRTVIISFVAGLLCGHFFWARRK